MFAGVRVHVGPGRDDDLSQATVLRQVIKCQDRWLRRN